MTKSETLNEIYKTYGLSKEDVYASKYYKVITRSGVQKVEAELKRKGLTMDIQIAHQQWERAGHGWVGVVTMKASGNLPEQNPYTTFASATTDNVKQQPVYLPEMAEKRVRARLILTLAGLYELGVYSEDEADDFKAFVKSEREKPMSTSTVKV